MRRLYRFLLFLMVIAVMLLLISRLVGNTRPKLEIATIMVDQDGIACDRPCLFGIRPGETSYEQAQQILQTHPLTRDARPQSAFTFQLTDPTAYIVFGVTQDNIVDSVTLTDNLYEYTTPMQESLIHSIHIGDLILAYGTPDVLLRLDSPNFVIGFPVTGIMASLPRPALDVFVKPETSVSTLMLYAVQSCPNEITIFKVQPWLGFTTMEQYANDLQKQRLAYRTTGIKVSEYAQCEVEDPERLNCFLCSD